MKPNPMKKFLILLFLYVPTVIAWTIFCVLFRLMTDVCMDNGFRGNVLEGRGMRWQWNGVMVLATMRSKRPVMDKWNGFKRWIRNKLQNKKEA